jgi:hypothetical protein
MHGHFPAPADSVVQSVFCRQQVMSERIRDVSYDADYRYTEVDVRQGRTRRVSCLRRVSMKGYERQRHDIRSVTVDGRRLSGRELEHEVNDLRSKGLVAGNTRMPFMTETRDEYRYSLLGEESLHGSKAWVLGFQPRSTSSRYIRGRAWVSKDSFDVVGLQFAPARVPLVVSAADMNLEYGQVDGAWLPVRFTMTMDLKLKVLITVLDRHLEIEDRYSGYVLNAGLNDSLFDRRVALPP